jgi:sensor histidine kinase YesM
MDFINILFYFCLLNGLLALSELYFFGTFAHVPLKQHHYVFYTALMYVTYGLEIYVRMSFFFTTAIEVLVLFSFGCLILRCRPWLSGITAILTITIMQIINGLFQTLTHIIYDRGVPLGMYGGLLLAAISLTSVISVFIAYRYTIKSFYGRKIALTQQVLILLLPTLFILLILQFIISSSASPGFLSQRSNASLMILQLSALGCLVTVLYAYRRLLTGFELEMRNTMLEQQAASQQDYMEELKYRYEQTRSFRHDIKNHWAVLESLILKEEFYKAQEYLGKLKDVTDKTSFPCSTGNTVINMLLSSKLGLAAQKGIHVDCTVKIPAESSLDDLDLCIVFSNAVDNAINALSTLTEGNKYLLLSAMQKGSFFMIEAENSRCIKDSSPIVFGIGLNNIKAVAQKYNGTISIEDGPDFFRLNVLFLIPQHQTYH